MLFHHRHYSIPWSRVFLLTFFSFWFIYFALFWSKAAWVDSQGNLIAGHVNIWGDWAAHLTMSTSYAFRSLTLTDSPLLVQNKFSYPFLADWISAVLIHVGLPVFKALIIPSYIFSCLIVVSLFWFYRSVFQSKAIAVLSTTIFLLNGGMGFLQFIRDVVASSRPLHLLFYPPHEYTRLDSLNIKWINVIDSMIIPQRAFTLGFPLALIILAFIYPFIFRSAKQKINVVPLFMVGLIYGILPIAHTHSFLAVSIILFFWLLGNMIFLLIQRKKFSEWKNFLRPFLIFFGVSIPVALGMILQFFWGHVGQSFFKWYPGWLAKEYKMSWITFWWRNWGITPILASLGWYKLLRELSLNKKPTFPTLIFLKKFLTHKQKLVRQQKWWFSFVTFLPFFVLFVAANLVLFQPFAWDNTKIFVWVSVGWSGLVGWLLHFWWSKSAVLSQNLPTIFGKTIISLRRFVIILLAIIVLASGTIDAVWELHHRQHMYQMYSSEELQLVDWVKQNTPTSGVWLTATNHNHWLFNLTGRQALMTYPGWLWTHGYNYRGIENDLYAMYNQPLTNKSLIEKYGVRFAVIGPQEKKIFIINAEEWAKAFKPIHRSGSYTIFEVKGN